MRTKILLLSLMAIALAIFSGSLVQASSHREAQAVLEDPEVDNTDVYAWV